MYVTVNGSERDVAPGATIQTILDTLGLNAKAVVAQRNDDIVPRDQFGETVLNDGDRLELIRFVGGG